MSILRPMWYCWPIIIFEAFRETALNYYRLDSLDNHSSSGLSWDACLTMINVSLELLTDSDKHLVIENGMCRGVGLSMINNHPDKAYNSYLAEVHVYDPTMKTAT